MLIIGCDYHPGFQQIAFVDQETGECGERRLQHPEEAQQFYRELHARGETVRVGMEASGHAQWFERLLGELHFQLDIGDAAEIRGGKAPALAHRPGFSSHHTPGMFSFFDYCASRWHGADAPRCFRL